MPEEQEPRGCSGPARLLIVLIVVAVLIALGLAIHTFAGGGPPANRMTPGGANYNPSQSGSVTTPAKPR